MNNSTEIKVLQKAQSESINTYRQFSDLLKKALCEIADEQKDGTFHFTLSGVKKRWNFIPHTGFIDDSLHTSHDVEFEIPSGFWDANDVEQFKLEVGFGHHVDKLC